MVLICYHYSYYGGLVHLLYKLYYLDVLICAALMLLLKSCIPAGKMTEWREWIGKIEFNLEYVVPTSPPNANKHVMQEVSGGVAPTHNHMHMPVHAIVSRNDVTCLYKIKNVNLHQEFSWAYVPKTRPSISHISLNSWWWWFWYMLMHNKQGWRCIYIYTHMYIGTWKGR